MDILLEPIDEVLHFEDSLLCQIVVVQQELGFVHLLILLLHQILGGLRIGKHHSCVT